MGIALGAEGIQQLQKIFFMFLEVSGQESQSRHEILNQPGTKQLLFVYGTLKLILPTRLAEARVSVPLLRQKREIPGVMEAARVFGQSRTPYAMLSRGVAGVCKRTIIVNLPGSSRGAAETMDAIFPALLHAFPMLEGGGH